jgi:hypothetical protein
MTMAINRLWDRSVASWRADLAAWGLTGQQGVILAAVPILIVLAMAAAVPFFDLFVWLTDEDSLIEWLQFLLLAASALLFVLLAMRLFRSQARAVGLLAFLVALGLFFVAGEEIAWGQRIFGWGTPAALGAVNVQNETTLHNISGAHQLFVYGVMLAGLYGAVAPLLRAWLWRERPRTWLEYLLIPPLALIPAFLMPFVYRFTRLALGIDGRFPHLIFPITKFSEVTELCLYFGVVIFAWLNLRRLYRKTA